MAGYAKRHLLEVFFLLIPKYKNNSFKNFKKNFMSEVFRLNSESRGLRVSKKLFRTGSRLIKMEKIKKEYKILFLTIESK